MIIFMSDVICVTNRKLCIELFTERIKKIAKAHPKGILLREKDMDPKAYAILAAEIMDICKKEGVNCILHSFTDVAVALGCTNIHLPLKQLRDLSKSEKVKFKEIGASCHSVEEALEAQKLGCTYIIAGHIFETDCKKGLPGRGHEFLKKVCESVEIPVYAIGGIAPENVREVRRDNAAGICLMSSLMTCPDVPELLESMEKKDEI